QTTTISCNRRDLDGQRYGKNNEYPLKYSHQLVEGMVLGRSPGSTGFWGSGWPLGGVAPYPSPLAVAPSPAAAAAAAAAWSSPVVSTRPPHRRRGDDDCAHRHGA